MTLGALDNAGTIFSPGAQRIIARRGINNSGTIQSETFSEMRAASVMNAGSSIVTRGSAVLEGHDSLTKPGTFYTSGALSVASNGVVINQGQISAATGGLILSAKVLKNLSGKLVAQLGDIDLVVMDEVTNQGGAIAANAGAVKIIATTLSQHQKAQLFAHNAMDITTTTLTNDATS